jgi:hypothetical protein
MLVSITEQMLQGKFKALVLNFFEKMALQTQLQNDLTFSLFFFLPPYTYPGGIRSHDT